MSLQRLLGLAGYGGNGGNGNKQVQPTFGVSFGLPQPSHGYPINPFNANPLHNPYGPALNGGGLNLGLVSVNPLLAIQVTKNDYGDKIVKPFVNLHVTPNEHVVNKLGHLFHEKKHYLLNKHEHYHHFRPHSPSHYPLIHPSLHGPHYHGHHPTHGSHYPAHGPHYPPHGPHLPPHGPHYPHGPPAPVYSPHFTHYEPGYSKINPVHQYNAPENISPGNDDYYDDDTNQYEDSVDYTNSHNSGFYNPGYERSANTSAENKLGYANRYAYSRSLTLPSKPSGANRGGQTIRFPDSRKKRDVSVEKSASETIEEVIRTPIIED